MGGTVVRLPTVGTEKCPCSPKCRTYFLTGVGRFVQGSGFDQDVAEEIAMRLNAHDDLVAALRACAETLRAIRMCYGFGSSKAITPQTQLALEGEIDKSLEPCRAALAALAKAGEK